MYQDEKTQGLQRMILFVEIFAHIKKEKVLKHTISIGNILFQISVM